MTRAIEVKRVAAGASATLLHTAGNVTEDIVIANRGATAVHIGAAGVTATTGFQVAAGQSTPKLTLDPGQQVFVIGTGTEAMHVLVIPTGAY